MPRLTPEEIKEVNKAISEPYIKVKDVLRLIDEAFKDEVNVGQVRELKAKIKG